MTRFGNWTSAVAAKRQGERQLGFGSTRACPNPGPAFKDMSRQTCIQRMKEEEKEDGEEDKEEKEGNMTKYRSAQEENANFVSLPCRPRGNAISGYFL